jgi:hypothetical protein
LQVQISRLRDVYDTQLEREPPSLGFSHHYGHLEYGRDRSLFNRSSYHQREDERDFSRSSHQPFDFDRRQRWNFPSDLQFQIMKLEQDHAHVASELGDLKKKLSLEHRFGTSLPLPYLSSSGFQGPKPKLSTSSVFTNFNQPDSSSFAHNSGLSSQERISVGSNGHHLGVPSTHHTNGGRNNASSTSSNPFEKRGNPNTSTEPELSFST